MHLPAPASAEQEFLISWLLDVLHTAGVARQGCYLCLSCRGKPADLQLLGQRLLVLMVSHP